MEVLIGASAAALQLYDHNELNALKKPVNLRFFHSPLIWLPLAYGEVEGEWSPEQKVTMDIKRPDPEPQEVHSYNTELYKIIGLETEPAVNNEDVSTIDQDDRDYDDWTAYPATESPKNYHLTGYCGLTGRAKFKKLSPIIEEEETFSIVTSETK